MLDGQLSFLIASRRLAALRHEIDAAADDADFLVFVAIDSETDALPLGVVRAHWDQGALTRLEPEIEEAERWAFNVGGRCMQVASCKVWRARTEYMKACSGSKVAVD